jgi:hypothetical protein
VVELLTKNRVTVAIIRSNDFSPVWQHWHLGLTLGSKNGLVVDGVPMAALRVLTRDRGVRC